MFVLFVSHNIYLTREQRYALADGESVEVIAPSVPVWFYKFNTSEPATEVFCKYILTNEKGPISVARNQEGYQINLPQMPEDYELPERIPDEKWRKMTIRQQEKWYEAHPVPSTGELLRDVKDGGAAYMRFQFDIQGRKNTQSHQIEIKDISVLLESLV